MRYLLYYEFKIVSNWRYLTQNQGEFEIYFETLGTLFKWIRLIFCRPFNLMSLSNVFQRREKC